MINQGKKTVGCKVVILSDCNGDILQICGPFGSFEQANEWIAPRREEQPDVDFDVHTMLGANDFWTDPEDVPC